MLLECTLINPPLMAEVRITAPISLMGKGRERGTHLALVPTAKCCTSHLLVWASTYRWLSG